MRPNFMNDPTPAPPHDAPNGPPKLARTMGLFALIVYGVWFWRKVQTPEEERRKRRKLFRTVGAVAALWLLSGAPDAQACSSCYGAAEGPMMDAAKLGVWLLYGMVVAVQLALGAFFLYLMRRSKRHHGAVEPWWTDMKEAHEP